MKYVAFAVACVLLLVVYLVGSSSYRQRQAEKIGLMAGEDASTFVRDHSRTLGSDDAKVVLVEFMDPACETCAAFSPFVKHLIDANPGKVKLVLRYAPFHDGADSFVRILEAAGKQGRYWETLEVMYKSQPYWASHGNPQPQRLWEFLPMAGLDVGQIRKDMTDPVIGRIIDQDLADAAALEVRKTPGFFVNGKPLQTFGSEQLRQLLISEIRAQYPD